jgi:hypothetical protein
MVQVTRIALICLLAVSFAHAAETLQTTVTVPASGVNVYEQAGQDGVLYDLVHFEGCDYLDAPGAPQIPAMAFNMALPSGYDVTGLAVKETHRVEMEGTYRLFPTQAPRRCSEPQTWVFTTPDDSIYAKNAQYPESLASLTGQGSLSGYQMAEVLAYPVHWNPGTGKVTVSDLEITLTLTPSRQPVKVKQRSAQAERLFRTAVQNLVCNPEQVPAKACGQIASRAGTVEYLCITRPEWVSQFQPLVDWKNRKGIPAELVTTTWVFSNYGTGTDDEPTRLRLCIKDYWQNKGLAYVLLAGDSANTGTKYMPDRRAFATAADNGNAIPCDLYFADLDGTWDGDSDGVYGEYPADGIDMYSDVYVGRATVGTTTQAADFVKKVLQYEGESSQPPLALDYQLKMLFMGSDLGGGGADGKDLKNKIDNESVPARFDPITKLYQTEGTLNIASAVAAMNEGQNLINHAGHGNNKSIQCGAQLLENSHINGLTNGPRYSILYSHACYCANFTNSDCIGEKMLNSATGGGFWIGNSRYGWHGIPYTESLSPKYDRKFFETIFVTGEYPLGAVHAEAKHTRVNQAKNQNYERYVMYELNLLGDPEMPIWQDVPAALDVTHDSSIPVGPGSLTVTVKSGGAWVMNARVCLCKDGEVYLTGLTNILGQVTLSPSPTTEGELLVTATKYDYLPSETAVIVGETLTCNPETVSAASGGSVNMELTAGSGNAGRTYFMLGGVTGTSPGTPLPGGFATLPLNWDVFTDLVLSLLNSPVFMNFMGNFDGSGNATAQLNSGPLPSSVIGLVMYYAYTMPNPYDFASNAVEVEVVP